MKAQISISTQHQMSMAPFLLFVCGVGEEGEIVKDSVGMASGWEEKVQLLSVASQCDLYFGLKQHGTQSFIFLLKNIWLFKWKAHCIWSHGALFHFFAPYCSYVCQPDVKHCLPL